jgi:hypothetical protein
VGDIGRTKRKIELEPLTEPGVIEEPAPLAIPEPAAVPAQEPEKVPV